MAPPPRQLVRNVLSGLGRRKADQASATEGRLVYAIGDVHGCYELLKGLLKQLTEDWLGRARGKRPLLVFCGDYIDRGPSSAEVVEAVIWLKEHSRLDVMTLKGNHEQGLLRFLEQPEEGRNWLRFGGAETLLSYGVQPPDSPEADGDELVRARNGLLQKMPAAHLRFLEALDLMLVVGDYAFVHAGVRPGVGMQDQSEQDLLWIRHDFLEAPGPFGKTIVHGHTWLDERPQWPGHRIGIDTGAYSTGVLTAVRLFGDEVGFIQARSASPARQAFPGLAG